MAESELVQKGLPCGECGSSDALAEYSDGHTYCFSCQHLTPAAKAKAVTSKAPKDKRPFEAQLAELLEGSEPRALQKWGITQATCRHWDYRTKAIPGGKGQHLAIYKDDKGVPCFVKVRVVDGENQKLDFFGVGDQSKVSLYGIERLGAGGKMVVVCEGEKDTLAASQLWANKFPVVGLPFGAESSGKAFAKAIDKLARYDKVVLALDMDRPGQEGTQELARMLPPGKVAIARFTSKDLHQMVVDEGPEKVINAIFNAAPYRPDGIVDADQLEGLVLAPTITGTTLAWPFMTEWFYGLRPGEIVVIGAGTGVGKSDLASELAAHFIKPKLDGGAEERCAVFNYEASPVGTLKGILGKLSNRRFHIPDPDQVLWTQEDLIQAMAYRRDRCAKLYINDHYGAVDWAAVKERTRYLKHSENVRFVFVDPLAALVAQEEDDRKALDKLFAEAKSLGEELGVNFIFNSHLTRPSQGPSHEEGGRVELKHFRGSNAIGMWASFVLGMERNQQADEEEERSWATIRVLKDRFTGNSTGKTQRLVYNLLTGRYELPVLRLEEIEAAAQEPPPL